MNPYDTLVGQAFSRNGTHYTIVRLEGAMVLATAVGGDDSRQVKVPLGEVIAGLEVPEVTVTELPTNRRDRPRV